MTSTATGRLSDADLGDLIELLRGADSAELKLTVPESAQRSAIAALEMDPIEAQIRQVFFFDTPDLMLDTHGVVVRARRVQGRGDDSVVKLRPVVPADVPAALRRSPAFGVEVDAMPGSFVCSASMKHTPSGVRDVVTAGQPVRKLFSKEQRKLFAAYAPDGVSFDDLVPLGPLFVLKMKLMPKEFGRKLVAEAWLYPDDTWILELSTKCAPAETFAVAAEARAFLARRGIALDAAQETKTRRALEFFGARAAAAAAAVPAAV